MLSNQGGSFGRRTTMGIRALLAVMAAGALCGSAAAQDVPSTPFIVTGMTVPGTSYYFTSVDTQPDVQGQYLAVIADTSGSWPGKHGVWVNGGSGLQMVASDTQTVPGAPGTIFASSKLALSRQGDVVFSCMGLQGFSVVRAGTHGLGLVELGDSPAPPGTAGNFVFTGYNGINNNGAISFEASTNLGSTTGLWSTAFGPLQCLALTGMAAPGGGVYQQINNNIRVSDSAIVERPTLDVYGMAVDAIVLHTAAGAQILARPGLPTTGLPDWNFNGVGDPAMNRYGQVAFPATIQSPAGVNGSKNSLFVYDSGAMHKYAATGDAAPAPGAYTFGSFSKTLVSDNHTVVFSGSINEWPPDGRRTGIWVGNIKGAPVNVAFAGQAAPGIAGKFLEDFSNIAVSDTGQVAFTARISPSGQTDAYGLFAETPDGLLHMIAYEGESFEVTPGQFGVIKTVQFAGDYAAPLPASFSGQRLVYRLSFMDGRSGIYTATLPGAAFLGGDANQDGKVTFADYVILANNFGQSGGWKQGDFNLDRTVTFSDYIALANNFGQSIPEPATLVLLTAAAPLITKRTHRRGR